MSASSKDEAVRAANTLLEELSTIVDQISELELERKAEHDKVDAGINARTDPLVARREQLVDQVAALFRDQRDAFTGATKSAFLRAATLSARMTPESIEVENEELAMKYLRMRGWLRRFTRVGKRVLDKRALKADPERARRIPGIKFVRRENLTISLTEPPHEIIRELNPLRREL